VLTDSTAPAQQQAQQAPSHAGDGAVAPAVVTKLSVVIPVYNESATIDQIIALVVDAKLPPGVSREIICINDCSTDGSREKLDRLSETFPGVDLVVVHKSVNWAASPTACSISGTRWVIVS
jgi:hypothetical protein